MARLYDRMIGGGGFIPSFWDADIARATQAQVLERLEGAPVIVADNVFKYYMEHDPKDVWLVEEDFPNVAPPFEAFWIETKTHDVVNRGGVMELQRDVVPGVGCLVTSERTEAGWSTIYEFFLATDLGVVGPISAIPLRVDTSGAPHVYRDGSPVVLGGGEPAIDPHEKVTVIVPFAERLPKAIAHAYTQGAIDSLKPFLLALSFMHCKNVEVRTVEPPKLSPYLKKKGVKPKVRYHVLDIDPMKKTLKTEGRSGEVGLKRALHICRGHFATYTEDAPLFGKYVGTFWKPQHVRGSAKHGAVVKDYNVKAPDHG